MLTPSPLAHVHALIGDAIDWHRRAGWPAAGGLGRAEAFCQDRADECLADATAWLDQIQGHPEAVERLRRVIAELGGGQ